MHLIRKEFIFHKSNRRLSLGLDECIREILKGNRTILAKISRCLHNIVVHKETHVGVYFVILNGDKCNCSNAKLLMLKKDTDKYVIYKETFVLFLSKDDTRFAEKTP